MTEHLRDFTDEETDDYLRRMGAFGAPPESRWERGYGDEWVMLKADATMPKIAAKPFVWRDPATIPRRQWVYGHHLIRRFLSTTVAPGAVGKSSLTMVEAIAMATGRALLGTHPTSKLRVWIWNGEDPLEEMERRVAAICLHYGIAPAELEGQLFLNSGRDTEIVIATTTKSGTVIAQPVVDAMKATIRENRIDVVFLDPFVACHGASENDNGAINAIAKTIARMADEPNTAWDLVHHSRKTGGAEITVEDGRGASALLAAARSGRVLNSMTKEEAERAGVEKPRGFFRVDNGKANLAPPPDKSEWFKLQSVSLGNGGDNPFDQHDEVAVVTPWEWPDAMADVTVSHLRQVQAAVAAGRWRENHQAKNWVGNAVAQVMKLDLANKNQKAKVIRLIKTWVSNGMLVTVESEDEKRMRRTFVEVGQLATD
jgi:hypothetical protein